MPADLRRVMGRFATGVTVVTTLGEDGEPHGMTANAVTSVSLAPPLVLVCVHRDAATAARLAVGRGFALSILHAGQEHLSDRFADPGRPPGRAGFAGVDVVAGAAGLPLVADALGAVECRVDRVHDGGDHRIVVGEVVAAGVRGGGAPLVFLDGAYLDLRPVGAAVA